MSANPALPPEGTDNPMTARLVRNRPLALSLLAGMLLIGLAGCAADTASAAHGPKPEDIVAQQFILFNVGMRSGNFSALAQVYAPNAILTKSGPSGVTTVYQGLPAILAYYHSLQAVNPGIQWTTDSMRSLAGGVVLVYEHAGSPPQSVPGRCVHVFVIQSGKIVTYDWAVFYTGKP
jgi:hypothetical protein